MRNLTRTSLRCTSFVLVCALLAPALANATPKPLNPQSAHDRIVKRGIGNWIWVEESNGIALFGRITSIDDQSVGLQLHNYPEITPVPYTDIVSLRTGPSRAFMWTMIGVGVGGAVALALIAHSEFENNKLPTLPPTSGFPN